MLQSISMRVLLFAFAMFGSLAANSQHQHHAKHNMLLQGEGEIFAYHIVYKVPHNYQVILRVVFDTDTKSAYLDAKQNYPDDSLVLLLDSMDIGQISKVEQLSGVLLRRDTSGNQETIKSTVTLEKDQFEILYFYELPLFLQSTSSNFSSPACKSSKGFSKLAERSGGPHKCDDWRCDQTGKCRCYD